MYPAALLNDSLKRFLPACSSLAKNPKRLAEALNSPYLTFFAPPEDNGFTEDEAKLVNLMADDGLLRTPFPFFRYCVDTTSGQMMGFVDKSEGELSLISFFKIKSGGFSGIFYAGRFKIGNPFGGKCEYVTQVWDAQTLKDISSEMDLDIPLPEFKESDLGKPVNVLKNEVQELRNNIKIREDRADRLRKFIAEAEGPITQILGNRKMKTGEKQSSPRDLLMAHYCIVSVICYEYLAPQNFMAVVRPSTQGKSVEWIKAREHITLIHRHHAANNANVSHGSTVNDSMSITRCAHSRRAHTRLLKSSRYTYKYGQRIAVKASWCGPKKWKDSAGQTYQILIPVAQ